MLVSEWHRTSDGTSGRGGSNEGGEVCRHAAGRPGDLGAPAFPEASVWAFSEQDGADFRGCSSYVNERLIVAASDS